MLVFEVHNMEQEFLLGLCNLEELNLKHSKEEFECNFLLSSFATTPQFCSTL
jgi:hypothetical protein